MKRYLINTTKGKFEIKAKTGKLARHEYWENNIKNSSDNEKIISVKWIKPNAKQLTIFEDPTYYEI